MKSLEKKRIKIPITVWNTRQPSDRFPGQAWNFTFRDQDNNEYSWDTTTEPEIYIDEKWLIKMTIIGEDECLGFSYYIVNQVKLIEKL